MHCFKKYLLKKGNNFLFTELIFLFGIKHLADETSEGPICNKPDNSKEGVLILFVLLSPLKKQQLVDLAMQPCCATR